MGSSPPDKKPPAGIATVKANERKLYTGGWQAMGGNEKVARFGNKGKGDIQGGGGGGGGTTFVCVVVDKVTKKEDQSGRREIKCKPFKARCGPETRKESKRSCPLSTGARAKEAVLRPFKKRNVVMRKEKTHETEDTEERSLD